LTMASPPLARTIPRIEWLLAGAVLLALGYAAWFFLRIGHLPQPFYYRVSDSLMDLFSTAYWANGSGAYTTWHAIYPPLSFVFLRVFSLRRCYAFNDFAGRGCDWLALTALGAFFCLNAVLVYKTYRLVDPRTAFVRALAISMGLPMLYALERGNLLIPCFTCFVLGYGDLLRREWQRALALALSINFKPYLLFSMLPFLARGRWRWLIVCGIAGLAVYLATYAAYGSGSPLAIIANEGRYAVVASNRYFLDIYNATSYWPLIRLLRAAPAGLILAPPQAAKAWALALTVLLRAAQVASLACLVASPFRPSKVNVRRLGAMVAAVSLTAFTTGAAGYAEIFLFFLVFFEPWRGPLRITVLVATYLLSIPADFAFLPVIHGPAQSYLGGREVMTSFGVSVGQLSRPAALLVIQCGLTALNFADLFGKVKIGVTVHIQGEDGLDFIARVAGASPRR